MVTIVISADLVQQFVFQLLDRPDERMNRRSTVSPATTLADLLHDGLGKHDVRTSVDSYALEDIVNQMRDALAEFVQMRERNSALAAALGACDCWGLNLDCEICCGEGKSGWAVPDKELFSLFVAPVLNTVRQELKPHLLSRRS